MSERFHPDFLKEEEVQTLFKAFAAKSVPLRAVGGAVRDALLGTPSSDVDFATTSLPEETMRLLQAAGLKAVPTGIKHGTITAVMPGGRNFEITTLRKDVATDGRHAQVAYTDDWQQDAARRDFTINALSLSEKGELFDYFGGFEDLKAGRVRFIGNADERIKEDYLRILRFFRFSARFAKAGLDEDALAACGKLASGMEVLSGERIEDEMMKILALKNISSVLEAMQQTGALTQALGKESRAVSLIASLETLEGKWQVSPDNRVRLALLIETAEHIAPLAARWKCSHALKDRLSDILRIAQDLSPSLNEAAQKKILRRVGSEVFSQAALVCAGRDAPNADAYKAMFALAQNWQPPRFELTGADLKSLGLTEGKTLGDTLKKLENLWEESGYSLSKDALLKLAQK